MWLGTADSGCAGMMHYRIGIDSAPSCGDAIRSLVADDLNIAAIMESRVMKRSSRSGSRMANGIELSFSMTEHFPIGRSGEIDHSREGEPEKSAQLGESGPFVLTRKPR